MSFIVDLLGEITVLSTSLYGVLSYFFRLLIRLFPLLILSVFLAELAKLRLGEERLKTILSGRSSLQGRLRAALLGALLPFCECGAFPIMVGLLKAGVSLKVSLTFFLISPLVSLPAFMILMGLFGLRIALLYLLITIISGLIGGLILERGGHRFGVFREGFLKSREGDCCIESSSCCGEGSKEDRPFSELPLLQLFPLAWGETWATVSKILPLSLLAILMASALHSFAPTHLIEGALSMRSPSAVPLAALLGIPIYTGDCTMILLVAPLIEVTRALGPGVAFIMAGAGTSINGLIFMRSIFRLPFLLLYILVVLSIAIATGYLLGFFAL